MFDKNTTTFKKMAHKQTPHDWPCTMFLSVAYLLRDDFKELDHPFDSFYAKFLINLVMHNLIIKFEEL